jgi:hypothetical protein
MSQIPLSAAIVAAGLGLAPAAFASSHREAPLITQSPKLDGTDFYLFRSYEKGRSAFVTVIANYLPLQDPYGGPNYFTLDPNALYDIHIDNKGDARPAMTFRFRFQQKDESLALSIGGKSVPVALTELGKLTTPVPPTQNVVETFTLSLVTYAGGTEHETPITNAATGRSLFNKPVDNIGEKTIPDYAAYAAQFMYSIDIPGCATRGRMFAGQRKDGFVVNLGETFDLVNYAHPAGEQFSNTTANTIGDKNVTSLALELPVGCVVNGTDPVIGAWTTSSSVAAIDGGGLRVTQASRLANPLVNEVVIGLPDKDRFNASQPVNDAANFLKYVQYPTFPAIVASLFGTPAPTAFPRVDLVTVFLTGIPTLNKPASLTVAGEEMRLNTAIPAVAVGTQNRLGVIGGDKAGFPNGRRPGDDVVDIELRVLMGRLYTLGLFGSPTDAPSGSLDFTDGACVTSAMFPAAFPYLLTPIPGSPKAATDAASTSGPPAHPGACK